ncbi:MAG: nucleotide-binding protein [Flavobacteriales bacterium]|nr:nucleotide-binding protein [Flavobacteriales bacterium]MCW8914205.1 nucleotide-binding protein [Flavobacteriales bacterium]MCW8937982.1 nucleotide-binding protein [Flavobacteriales bacterium]MCW8967980.1 nucleotide-binding protein [Flavobacteriales bacterium]MCW8991469.1 nucleotide-binding protein [Flavobacteriales bacterium]
MNPIEKLNNIVQSLEQSENITNSEVILSLTRVQNIIKNYLGEDSEYIAKIQLLKKKIENSLLGYNNYHYIKAKGLIDIVIDEFEFKLNILITPLDETFKKTEKDKTKVFIVHGHDDSLKNDMARFIEKIGLEAIILHEQNSESRTIIEKIEKYSNVGYGIILYSPCDIGAKKGEENNLKGRARQNVVFEHGYLIGKIGRENVSAIVKGNIEKPNDISGVIYIPYSGDWKITIIRELQNKGYKLDTNSIFK